MELRQKYILTSFIILTAAMFFGGNWLMSLYGLDPPYLYFNAGMYLYLASIASGFILILFVVITIVFHCLCNRREKSK